MIEVQTIGKVSQTMVDVSDFALVMDFSTGPGLDNGGAAEEIAGLPAFEGLRQNVGKMLR